jgi:methionyl-tRNA formyltransferase
MPWPGAYTKFRGQTLHIWKSAGVGPAVLPASPLSSGLSASTPPLSAPGRLTRDHRTLLVTCGENSALELLEIQLEGKKRITGEAFANGQRLQENEILGGLS